MPLWWSERGELVGGKGAQSIPDNLEGSGVDFSLGTRKEKEDKGDNLIIKLPMQDPKLLE